MQRISTLDYRSQTIMSEEEFESILSKPLEVADALLARNPALKNLLERQEPNEHQGKNTLQKTWGDLFPGKKFPDSLAHAKTAVCLGWFHERFFRHRDLDPKDGDVKIIVYDNWSSFTRSVTGRSGTKSASVFMIRDEAKCIQRELATPEISGNIGLIVLKELRDALTEHPELLMENPVEEPVPLEASDKSATMSSRLAKTLFLLLKLNALENKG